jgi:hypothetical protein
VSNNNGLIKGSYRVEVVGDEGVVFDSGEFNNLITDAALSLGRPFYTSGSFKLYFCLGAGVVTTPTYADTNLGNQIASKAITGFSAFDIAGDIGTYPELFKQSKEVEFTGISGDISEVGLRSGASNGALLTRSLIKDESGDPITITVTPEQTVRVTYSLYSIISSPVIDSGVFSASFGTSNYQVMAGAYINGGNRISGVHAHLYDAPFEFPGYGSANVQLRRSSDSSNYTSGSITYSVDLINRQCVATLSVDSNSDGDFTFDEILPKPTGAPNSPGWLKTAPWIKLDSELTLPQYISLSFDITFTWGRYDSGA